MKKGLSLLELVIAIGLASVVGLLLVVIIINSAGIFYKQSSTVGQGLGLNDSLTVIRQSIKESSSIAPSYQVGSTIYTSGPLQLVLKVSSLNSSNEFIPNVYDYFVFFLDEDKLRFKSFPDAQSSRKSSDRILSLNVNTLLFQYYSSSSEVQPNSAEKIKITLRLRQKSGANFETNIATSEASLVNN